MVVIFLDSRTLTNCTADSSSNFEITAECELQRENLALKARVVELEQLVACDTLTPAFNRRHFMAELNRWCWRKHISGGEYGLLFVDVDNLKIVNDQHGHSVGDILLIAIAEALLAAVRGTDIVARIGGDEFAILLADVPADKIRHKAEHISEAIGRCQIPHQNGRLTPRISVGFVAVEPDVSPSDLLLRADQSMYAAKRAKRTARLN